MSPFDSLLEFLLSLIRVFNIHRIEDKLFSGADGIIIDPAFRRWPRIYMIDFFRFLKMTEDI